FRCSWNRGILDTMSSPPLRAKMNEPGFRPGPEGHILRESPPARPDGEGRRAQSDFPPPPVNRKKLTSALVAAGIVLLAILLARLGLPYLSAAAKAFVAAVCVLLGIWLAVKAYRAFLWKVGRRLAFS